MVHETCHMFGMKHCIYYECTMNGTNGESTGKGTKALCPVCYKKLKRNVKFDTVERMKGLIEVCTELGFNKEAKLYTQFLAEAEEYKKTLPPKP